MVTIELKELYEKQKELDLEIAKLHHISYQSTRNQRILALYTELGELANTTRCFKFWSNKGKMEDDVILDEYADGLHFFLSLGIDIGYTPDEVEIDKSKLDLTNQFLLVYHLLDQFDEDNNNILYIEAFKSYLALLYVLGYDKKKMKEAYIKKLAVNHDRQENNY